MTARRTVRQEFLCFALKINFSRVTQPALFSRFIKKLSDQYAFLPRYDFALYLAITQTPDRLVSL